MTGKYLRISLLLLSALIFSLHLNAQLSKAEYYNKIDNKVFPLIKNEHLTIDSVVGFVNSNFTLNEDKVRAYYTFIALTIAYDVKHLEEIKIPIISAYSDELHYSLSQEPHSVLKNRKGVCEGISRLMKQLCAGSGIPCEMVVGYSKPGGEEVIEDILHSWNVVKIDSSWKLIDVTWSNGYINYRHEFVKVFTDLYFLSDPSRFAIDHLSMDPMWQLTERPLKKDYYFKSDTINGKYYSTHFNYNDSIKNYMNKTGLNRTYASLLNYHRFDPSNKIYTRNIDVLVNNYAADKMNIAMIHYEDFINFYNKVIIKKPTKKNFQEGLTSLVKSKEVLITAQGYMKNKTAFTSEFIPRFAQLNENIETNISSVNKSIALMKQQKKKAK